MCHRFAVEGLHKTALIALAGSLIACSSGLAAETAKITYDEHVQPILRQKCFSCHNPDKKSSGLDLTTYSNLMLGGASGDSVERGAASDSYLYMLVSHESEPFMPPKSDPLPDEMLAVIAKWIDGGALENKGSRPHVPLKPKFDFALKGAPTGKPEGPPPMPGRLTLEPIVHTTRENSVTALATSPWAPLVAVAGQKQVLLYHSQDLTLLGVLPFPEGVPHVLRFSRSGNLLLAGGGRGASRGRVIVWSIQTGERVFEVGDELDVVLAADISADQTQIAVGGPNRVVRIYSTRDGKLLHELRKHTDWITSISFSPDGVLLATGDRNGGLFVWEAFTAREYLSLRGHSRQITELSWRLDSNILASCSEDAGIRLWEMENGGNVKTWGAHGGGVSSLEFTRDGRLVSCGRDKVAKLWDQGGKQLIAVPAFTDIALQVSYCDETNRVIAADWTGAIRSFNAADGKATGELTANPPMLEERLAAAHQLASTRAAESTKLATVNQAAAAAVTKVQAELDAANKALVEGQDKEKTGTQTAEHTTKEIATLTATKDAAAKTVAAFEPVVGPLEQAAQKAQEAASKAAEDKQLAAAAAAIKTQADEKKATLETAKKTVADSTTALDAKQKQLAAAQEQVKQAKATVEAAQKAVAEITPRLKAATDAAAAAKTAADAAAQALVTAQQESSRWEAEIVWEKKRREVVAHQVKYNELVAVAQAAEADLRTSEADVAAANQAAETAKQQSEATAQVVQAAEQLLKTTTDEATAITNNIATLDKTIPLLQETLAKGQQAADNSGGDAEVAAAVAAWKTLLDAKVASLDTAKKNLDEKQKATVKATEQLAVAKKKAGELLVAFEAATKLAADKLTKVEPAQQKLAGAQSASEAAKKVVDGARAELNASTQPATQAHANAGS